MDFQPEIYGPYAPCVDFLIENMVCKVHKWPFEEKNYRKCRNSYFCWKIKDFKMAISTIPASPNPTIPIIYIWAGAKLTRTTTIDRPTAQQLATLIQVWMMPGFSRSQPRPTAREPRPLFGALVHPSRPSKRKKTYKWRCFSSKKPSQNRTRRKTN